MTTLRFASFAAAILYAATPLSAQSLATYGSAEVAGFGEGSALLGATLSSGHQGWGPIASLVGQTYRFRDGVTPTSHTQAWALSPAVGLEYVAPEGSVQGSVGYSFVSSEATRSAVVAGNQLGSKNGVFVSAQANYWGDGENSAQWIGSYGFGSKYYWTRGRAAHRLEPSANPIYLGAELVLQGSNDFTPSIFRYEVGPTIEYRATPEFRVGASAGYRGGNNSAAGTGYGRVEFLLLSKL